MRWTDLPAALPVRSLAAWGDALLARDPGAHATIEALVRRATAGVEHTLVLVDVAASDAALRHVRGSALERGGLLVGSPIALGDAAGPIALVHVTAAIGGSEDNATTLSLRMGTEVWTRANARAREGEVVVGWFHSHPGIGAFFSDTDRRTQAAFFAQPYSLGWVIDPVRGEDAFFLGSQARSVPRSAITLA
jgi:hypothetical protein